jgi:hypothetical protein
MYLISDISEREGREKIRMKKHLKKDIIQEDG